jgi:hypothetical protein
MQTCHQDPSTGQQFTTMLAQTPLALKRHISTVTTSTQLASVASSDGTCYLEGKHISFDNIIH